MCCYRGNLYHDDSKGIQLLSVLQHGRHCFKHLSVVEGGI